jgi:iron complex transport system substrate-binding protein
VVDVKAGRLLTFVLATVLVASMVLGAAASAGAAGKREVAIRLNGQELPFDLTPFIERDRTMVPARALGEFVGAEVTWEGKSRTVILTRGDRELRIPIGSKRWVLNGRRMSVDVPARLVGGRAFVPLRFACEALGLEVGWDPATWCATVAWRVTIRDATGKEIVVPGGPRRVVVLNTDAAEAMRLLRIPEDVIVGVGDTVKEHSYLGLGGKPSVGKWMKPDLEKIVELGPQVVVTYGKWPDQKLEEKLEPLGIRVVRLDFYQPATYDAELLSLAKVFGKEKRAREFLRWKDAKIALLADHLKGMGEAQKVKVYGAWYKVVETGQWKAYGQDTAVHQGVEMAGGMHISRELKGYPEVSAEWVLTQNPEVVVLGLLEDQGLGYRAADYSQASKLREAALADKVIAKTAAGQKGRVYLISTRLMGGDKTYLGALYLAKWFYPDRFRDVVPEGALKEYFQWLGVPFAGKWAYPEP